MERVQDEKLSTEIKFVLALPPFGYLASVHTSALLSASGDNLIIKRFVCKEEP